MSVETAEGESGTKARTRRAILEAAVEVLTRNNSAPLSDIAAAANVGRSTLHRYYPERADLVRALGDDAVEQLDQCLSRARPSDGPATTALTRAIHECFELQALIGFLYTEPQLATDVDFWQRLEDADRPLLDLIDRGRADGSFNDKLATPWIRRMFWWSLVTGWEFVECQNYSKVDALAAITETLTAGVITSE